MPLRRRLTLIVGIPLSIIVLGILITRVASGWDTISPLVQAADAGWILASLLLFAVGETVFAGNWLRILTMYGARPFPRRTVGAFYVSSLGRLLPGAVVPYFGRVLVADRINAPREVVVLSLIFEAVMSSAAAASLASLMVLDPTVSGAIPGGRAWLVAFPILLGLGLLAGSGRIVNPLLQRLSRPAIPHIPVWKVAVRYVLFLLTWLSFGAALWSILQALNIDGPSFITAAGMFAASWLLGFLFVIAPGGLGIREGVLSSLLAIFVDIEIAIAIALAARIAWWLVLGALAGLGGLMFANQQEATNRSPTNASYSEGQDTS